MSRAPISNLTSLLYLNTLLYFLLHQPPLLTLLRQLLRLLLPLLTGLNSLITGYGASFTSLLFQIRIYTVVVSSSRAMGLVLTQTARIYTGEISSPVTKKWLNSPLPLSRNSPQSS